MKSPLNIVHLEDSLMDAALIETRLESEGVACKITRVCGRHEFRKALGEANIDLILSDFSMPSFDGLTALEVARKERPEVPFIFISGTIGEELAVEALKEGATDYVIKDRMSRLPAAVQRAMREAEAGAERRRVVEDLRKSEERFQLATRATQDVVWDWDLAAGKVWRSANFKNLIGQQAEAVDSEAGDWGTHIHPLDKERVMAGIESAIRSNDQTWSEEYTLLRSNGTVANVLDRGYIVRDGAGKASRIIGAMMDITERKRLEHEALRNQRVATLGALAGGIAHDLNNTLAPVVMSISVLRQEPISAEAMMLLDLMGKSAQRGSEMVNQILSFSRGVGGRMESVEVRDLIEEISRLAKRTLPRQIELTTRIQDNLPPIKANSTQMHQVLLNLCVNARDAMPHGGTLTIEAEPAGLKMDKLPQGQTLNPGTYVLIKVSDTGHGIPPEILGKIFEPFFTTKENGHGTGLGLSTVMGIVKTHNGFLEVVSEPDRGTTFKIYLPACDAE